MKFCGILAGALALALSVSVAFGQTNPGASPLTGAKGGTNNAFMQFTGPATSMKTFTLPNVSDTIVLLTQAQTLTNKTLTAPVLGVATATSLAVNGASIGSHALAVVGSSSLAGSLRVPTGSSSCISTGNTAPTNPAFEVDCSTASQAAGVRITGAATGGTVAIAAIDSGANASLSLNAKGSGTIAIGNSSTGAVTISRALTLSNALTYGGVTLSNAVTGTGNMVLSTSPVLTTPNLGTPSALTLTNATGLPLSGHTSQAAYTFVGNNTGSSAAPTAVDIAALTTKASPAAGDYVILSDQAASGAWRKATVSSVGSAGSVSSIAGNTGAFTLGNGLTNSTNDIRVSLSTASNILGSDVFLNNTSNYFDGPSMAQGTTGTWYASGTVTLNDAGAAASNFYCKLWDGTTVISSANMAHVATANLRVSIALSGILASPAANIRISCRNADSTGAVIEFNRTGNSKDSSIYGFRIQ